MSGSSSFLNLQTPSSPAHGQTLEHEEAMWQQVLQQQEAHEGNNRGIS